MQLALTLAPGPWPPVQASPRARQLIRERLLEGSTGVRLVMTAEARVPELEQLAHVITVRACRPRRSRLALPLLLLGVLPGLPGRSAAHSAAGSAPPGGSRLPPCRLPSSLCSQAPRCCRAALRSLRCA
jgi:hypothetical protein